MHCHVVPGVDDGCPDAAASVEVCGQMAEMGLKRIIASPHVTGTTFENTVQTLTPAFSRLQEALKGAGMEGLVTDFGAENRLDDLFKKNFDGDTLISHPNHVILIENPFIQEPWNLEQIIFDLQLKGYQPVMAHPERFAYYVLNPGKLKKLHDKVPFQVNVLSLAGHYGKHVRKMAESLIDARMVDFLGTDFHNTGHTAAVRDYLATRTAARDARALSGKLLNDRIFR